MEAVKAFPYPKQVADISDTRTMLQALKKRLEELRAKHKEEDRKAKLERKKVKEQRDYEIYDEMPYKFNTKTFSLKERHPISKMRFEHASAFI